MIHRRAILALSLFSALSCLAGGLPMVVSPHGNDTFLPIVLLAPSPFATFLIPGLLLLVVGGGTHAAAFVATWRRSAYAIDLAILAGGAMSVWILCELVLLRAFSMLQIIYGLSGVGLLALGLHAGMRSGEARHRWVILVTSFEALGFLAPAATAIVATVAGASEALTGLLVVSAGGVEGWAMGTGQGLAFPLPIDRRRYTRLSAAGAAAAWALALSAVAVGGSDSIPGGLATAYGVVAGLGAVVALVGAQYVGLRGHSASASVWIGWASLAWVVALPLSFAPAPLVDATTPLDTQLVLWPSAGLLMAYVMALVTWQGARRVARSDQHPSVEDTWRSSGSWA